MDAELKTIADRLRTCGCPLAFIEQHVKAMQALHRKRSKPKPKPPKTYRVLGRRKNAKDGSPVAG